MWPASFDSAQVTKDGALIHITVWKVWISLGGGYPYVELFRAMIVTHWGENASLPVRHRGASGCQYFPIVTPMPRS